MKSYRYLSVAILLLVFLPQMVAAQDPLPKRMTAAEKEIFQQYLDDIPAGKQVTPPASFPRTPGEYEEVQGMVVTWAAYSAELREIVRHARTATTVYIICSNPSQVQSYLTSGNVPLDNIVFIQAAFNSVWIRDYGPQSIYLADGDQLAFVDWVYNRPRPSDNLIPGVLANYFSLPIFQMTTNPNRLIATGGNFIFDGFGSGFSSELILTENSSLTETQIDNMMLNYLGIDRYIKMPELPYDNISHIDMHMKLLNEETFLVGQFPSGVSDGPFIESNLQNLLNNHMSVYDRPYKVVRIPMVPSSSGNYPPNASYRTYTNSIILNNLVLVPTYGHFLDTQALQIYQDAMPGYQIVGINMENVIGASGAIHCIVREIAAEDPILFAHATPDYTASWQESYEIKVSITSFSGIENATLHWATDPMILFTPQEMVLENDTFRAWIPGQDCTAEIAYYFSATNGNGKTSSKPLVAPGGYYRMVFSSEGQDFFADNKEVAVGETVTFSLCEGTSLSQVWDFGVGAEPAFATGAGPHEVVYHSSGQKTVVLTYDGTTDVVKANYIKVAGPDDLVLLIEAEGQGTTQPAPGTYYYESGTSVELTAVAVAGWEFENWILLPSEIALDSETITFTMEENTTAKAIFRQTEVSVSLPARNLRFKVYPNPSEGLMTLSMPASGVETELVVTTIHGQLVFRKIIAASAADPMLNIDLRNQPAGIYLIRLTSGNETGMEKVVIR